MSDDADTDPLPPAEERLLHHVRALREHPPQADDQLVAAVLRAARWQAIARPYLAAMGALASAFGTGIYVSLASRRR